MSHIKFGTDGWRAVIARDFTFANVEVVTQAIADYMESQKPACREVLIGFDCRFMARQFAHRVADVLAGNAFQAELLDRPFPTPYVSYEVKRRSLAGGVMVTASHNPPEFCGIKFKAPFGGSATPAIVKEIENRLHQTAPRRTAAGHAGAIQEVAPRQEYFDHVKSLVDFGVIRKAKPQVVADAMHGAAQNLLEQILGAYGITCFTIRDHPDPLFGGIFPEPMEENLGALRTAILDKRASIGLATDGDADRLGAMDGEGNYVNTHQILALLILYLVRQRGWKGKVVKTVSQSVMIERICQKLGLECTIVPIGFKNIADLMLHEDILIGGEESGGVGIKNHIPERDGILISLLMLEAFAHGGHTLKEEIERLWKEFGEFHFKRRDLHVPLEFGMSLVQRLRDDPPAQFSSLALQRVDSLDGTKLIFTDESWILFRQSGTEPLLRIYCEAGTLEQVRRMMKKGEELARGNAHREQRRTIASSQES
ncbi:MAG: phosphoglucomutase/phosphomannomutase family protein [Acidobacteria bacterium]|nr:phosphoglucomutase/phosphomannomutase family protein [Acidobacteriota bacterium]MCI0717543.1 phosphoglucomutase/phosphomannomutase family protein [Acidobacteriota bacterium]